MFRLDGNGEHHYVIHGVWPHDDAIDVARKVRLTMNPINGLPQIDEIAPPPGPEVRRTAGSVSGRAVARRPRPLPEPTSSTGSAYRRTSPTRPWPPRTRMRSSPSPPGTRAGSA